MINDIVYILDSLSSVILLVRKRVLTIRPKTLVAEVLQVIGGSSLAWADY